MLHVVMLSVAMLNIVMLNVIMLNVVLLNVIMLNVNMLNVVMLSVVRLNVVAPSNPRLISCVDSINGNATRFSKLFITDRSNKTLFCSAYTILY
jgi:hypothetical protein